MTTKVTIDAHGGRDIEVSEVTPDGDIPRVTLVVAGTVHEFYIYGDNSWMLEEVKK